MRLKGWVEEAGGTGGMCVHTKQSTYSYLYRCGGAVLSSSNI